MPFKPGKSPTDVAKAVDAKLFEITAQQLPIALETVAYAVGARADFYVPIDTSALINSRSIRVEAHEGGFRATIGYYQEYAKYLHGINGVTPIWTPKPSGTPGKKTGGYNANAEPNWITKGAAEIDMKGMLAQAMKV